jgi:hypothetical protein
MEPNPHRYGRNCGCRASVLGAPLIMRLYGPGFPQGWLVLVLLAATAVISSVNAVVGIAIISGGSV